MIADIIKKKKDEVGMTTASLSKLSGVPVGTINKILNGETKYPRYDTLAALERVLFSGQESSALVRESASAYGERNQGSYTIEDYRALPDDVRAELIDGRLFYLEAPSTGHQILITKIVRQIDEFIDDNHGDCIVLPAPLDVQLDCDDRTMLQPDISIICKKDRINRKGIFGAPDLVMEITSPSTRSRDCALKLCKYQQAGVREYWIVDVKKRKVITYFFDEDPIPTLYPFDAKIPVKMYEAKLEIDLTKVADMLDGLGE